MYVFSSAVAFLIISTPRFDMMQLRALTKKTCGCGSPRSEGQGRCEGKYQESHQNMLGLETHNQNGKAHHLRRCSREWPGQGAL